MVAVLGRRRVGKTFLVEKVLGEHIIFSQTGVRGASGEEQREVFVSKMKKIATKPLGKVNSWLDAFYELRNVLEPLLDDSGEKKVIFFDELSWLAAPETEFLNWMGHFWNDWAWRQPIMIVLCGSVSSWITQKVVNDRGGLHNRITKYVRLSPFNLYETAQLLRSKNISLGRYEIAQLYMSLGGIPFYYEELKPGLSVEQFIDQICFHPQASLRDEFNRLYPALFDDAHYHLAVIRALASSRQGLDRTRIIEQSGIPNGGLATRVLDELTECHFIEASPPFERKKQGTIYRLIDEYSLFYLKFIEGASRNANWLTISDTQAYRTWRGYAFENVCMKHIDQIKEAMGISGISTSTHSFNRKANDTYGGIQVDMLLRREGKTINLFEIKFYDKPYVITKEEHTKLRNRIGTFKERTNHKYHIMLAYVTPFGVKQNKWSLGLVQQSIILDDLFDPAKPRPVLI